MIKFVWWLINGFISTFSFGFIFYKLTNSTKKLNVYIVLFYLIGVFMATYIEYWSIDILSFFSYFMFFPFLFYLLNPMPFKKLMYYVLVIWFYGMVLDLLAMLVITVLRSYFVFDTYGYIFESLLTCYVSLMLFLLSHSVKIKNFTNNVYNKFYNMRFSDVLIVLFAFFTFLIGVAIFINLRNLNVNLLLILVVILVLIVFVILIKFRINTTESRTYLKNLKDNNDFYIKMEEENRIFKHNLVAKLLSIKSVSNKKAMLLIEDLITQFNKSIEFSKNMKIIPYGLNGIIYQKLYPVMKELKIEISNDLEYDIFEVLNPRRYNVFIEKMVIALDNAIESCLKSKDKSLVINIYDDDNNICVEIENTFGNDINLDLLGSKDYSTKGHKHGLGLFSALRNNEASLNVKIINNIFVSKIVAKKHPID